MKKTKNKTKNKKQKTKNRKNMGFNKVIINTFCLHFVERFDNPCVN